MTTPTTSDALDMIIFGGSGDLSARKLLPALYMCHRDSNLPANTRIFALGRKPWRREEFLNFVETQSKPFIEAQYLDEAVWQNYLTRLHYLVLDAADPAAFAQLQSTLAPEATRIFYMATPPTLFSSICTALAHNNLITPQTRVVLEKPLGTDLTSALNITRDVGQYFKESQIYRIDHYLGKETVQNLMALRFGNAIFEPLWRAPTVKSVQITVAETVGVGTRGGFYNEAGAMRDMVQNHLLQLLSIVAMEPPASMDSDAVRDEKLKVLRSLSPFTLADVSQNTVRGQYKAGASGGQPVVGYLEEADIPPDSNTETFVALRTQVNTWRWAHIPFFLRTGKRMAEKRSEIVINFSEIPHSIFSNNTVMQPNRMVIQLQPEESVELRLMAKEPGDGMRLKPVNLGLNFDDAFTTRSAEAYERLLLDVIRGRIALFVRHDELEAAWRWVDPIMAGWQQLGERPRPYMAGSWGPGASSALVAREGLQWPEEI